MTLQLWLNLHTHSIHQSNQVVPLRPKVFAFLQFLMAHPGQIVSVEEVQQAVWGTTRISQGTLKNCVLELRAALGDKETGNKPPRPPHCRKD